MSKRGEQNRKKRGCLEEALRSGPLGLRRRLRNSLASCPRARDHVDMDHVMLADTSENGIVLT